MRRFFFLIGAVTLALGASGVLWATSVSAAESTTYQLTADAIDQATLRTGTSNSYTLRQSTVTWKQTNLTSTSYQIVDPFFEDPAGGTTGGTGGSTGGGGTTGGGGSTNRRPRPSSSSASSVSSATSSASSAASEVPQEYVSSSASSAAEASSSAPSLHEAAGVRTETSATIPEGLTIFGADHRLYDDLHEAAPRVPFDWIPIILVLVFSLGWLYIAPRKKAVTSKKPRRGKKILAALLLAMLTAGTLMSSVTDKAYAAQTTPNKHVYNGRLLNSSGAAVTTAQSIRFSYWTSKDYVSGDVDGTGGINTGAATYANWTEVHTVTPNSNGYFSVEMGSVTTLPDFSTVPIATLLSLYLQVEVKPSASANTAYELLDIDPNDTAVDRSGVLSVPFALNADTIDKREIGAGSGSIAILGSGGTFPVSTIPAGTNASSFTLDSDNTETSEISLVFGATLNKKLTYDIINSIFRFNANVDIVGNLTVSGTINGINLSQLQSATGALKSWSGGGLNLNVSSGNYRLNGVSTNYAGGSIALTANATNYVYFGSAELTKNTTGFPTGESIIPVSVVTTNGGSITSVVDKRELMSDDREKAKTLTFTPNYEKATYEGDGTSNIGQLSTTHDDTNLQNHYLWTSTKSALQDYDIIVRVPISEYFSRWQNSATANAISFMYRSTLATSADNKLDISVFDTAGAAVTLSGSTTNLASATWATAQVEFTGSPTWTPGQDMVIRIKMSAKDSNQMQLGSLKINTMNFGE